MRRVVFWVALLHAQSPEKTLRLLLDTLESCPPQAVKSYAQKADLTARKYLSQRNDSFAHRVWASIWGAYAFAANYEGQNPRALAYIDKALEACQKARDPECQAEALSNKGYYLEALGKWVEAIEVYYEGIQIAQDHPAAHSKLRVLYNNLAVLYAELGKVDSALIYHQAVLHQAQKQKDTHLIALAYNNLAFIYDQQGLIEQARQAMRQALALRLARNDHQGIAYTLNNLGYSFHRKGQYDSARVYYEKALTIAESINSLAVKILVLSNLGRWYAHQGDSLQALTYLFHALRLRKALKDPGGIAKSFFALADFYLGRKDYRQALSYADSAQQIAQKLALLDLLITTYQIQHQAYAQLGNYPKAYNTLKGYLAARESLLTKENQRKAMESSFELEWAQREGNWQKKLIQSQEAQKRQRLLLISVAIILSLVGTFSVLLYLRYRESQKQRQIIAAQKSELQEAYTTIQKQHQDLLDSLRYAQRLQKAFLPLPEELNKLFPQGWWLHYNPRDMVGGDFYWARALSPDQTLWVVGDCTGHGAPGAFLTVLAITLLNQLLQTENPSTDTAHIAEHIHEGFIQTLASEKAHGQSDGMEIAIFLWNRKDKILSFTLAGLHALLQRDSHLEELPTQKRSIGGLKWQLDNTSFHMSQIPISHPSWVYVYTDGIPDQLDPTYKRFGRKKLMKFLSEQSDPYTASQALFHTLTHYAQGTPQTDDQTLLAIRLA
ncbi:MAG: tetratricopeptide repeat protein [Bacteroidia bacterium]